MSETKEGEKYNLYDFTKSIYIFSHMKTLLVDKEVQEFEQKLLAIIQWILSRRNSPPAVWVTFG